MNPSMKRIARSALRRIGLAPINATTVTASTGLWDGYTRDAMGLAQWVDCDRATLAEPQQHPERLAPNIADRTCNWYLPVFDSPYYGGVMTILRLAAHLRSQHGIAQRFLICGPCDAEALGRKIGEVFMPLAGADVRTLDSPAAIEAIPASDYSVATLWTTAYVLLAVRNTGLKFYMIQDYEPLFYPAGSTYAQAELTYRFGFYGIANTNGVRDMYEGLYGGRAVVLTPSIDTSVFHPGDPPPADVPRRLFYYARPGTPRNAFELAAAAFRLLKHRMGDRVEIVCAGAAWNPADYQLDGIVTTVGMLPYAETGGLYRSCHVGLAMMMTRHPSYLPFELMACGTLVVCNRNPANDWLLKDGENCLLADPTASCLAETLAEALDGHERHEPIRRRAAKLIARDHSDWSASLERVATFMHDPTFVPPPPVVVAARPPGIVLAQARDGTFGDKVYVCSRGRRHYVPSVDRLAAYGLRWPDDLTQVTDEVLQSHEIGGWLPRVDAGEIDDPSRISSSSQMREYIAASLHGEGLEVGAGASPFPVPLHCSMRYGDRIPHQQLVAELYPGQTKFDLVRPDVLTDFDDFDNIEDGSLDFIVGCHVIEHVFDPIGTLVNAHRKLRLGGKLVLVVPDPARTFDRDRPLTPLDHLIEDHVDPQSSRDYLHYEEFYRLAFRTEEAALRGKVDAEFARRGDLHVHVWSYASFGEMVDHVRGRLCPWSSVWSHPVVDGNEQGIEFYYVLTK